MVVIEVGPLALVTCFGCCELEVGGYEGEPALVSGVRLLLAAGYDEAFRAVGGLEALKTDEAVLACELADPTPLRVSPCSDSVSSVGRCAASDDEGSDLMPSR